MGHDVRTTAGLDNDAYMVAQIDRLAHDAAQTVFCIICIFSI